MVLYAIFYSGGVSINWVYSSLDQIKIKKFPKALDNR
jgi:hypothetical protein